MGERFLPWLVHGRQRVDGWERVDAPPWLHHRVYVGKLPDGRWWAETSAERCGWAYDTEAEARYAAEAMRGEGDWEPVRGEPDAGRPPRALN